MFACSLINNIKFPFHVPLINHLVKSKNYHYSLCDFFLFCFIWGPYILLICLFFEWDDATLNPKYLWSIYKKYKVVDCFLLTWDI